MPPVESPKADPTPSPDVDMSDVKPADPDAAPPADDGLSFSEGVLAALGVSQNDDPTLPGNQVVKPAPKADDPEPTPEPKADDPAPTPEPKADDPEPTPEPEADDPTPEPDDSEAESVMDPRARSAFKRTKNELRDLKAQLEEQSKELESLRSGEEPADAALVKKLQSQVEEQEAIVRAYKMEQSQEYKSTVVEPLNKALAGLQPIAEDYDIPSEKLNEVLSLPSRRQQNEALQEMVESANMDRRSEQRFYSLVDQVVDLFGKADELKSRASEEAATLAEKEKLRSAEASLESKEAYHKMAESTYDKMSDRHPDLIGDDMLLGEVKAVDLATADLSTRAAAAVTMVLVPKLENVIAQQDAEITKLQATLDQLQASNPASRPAGSSPGMGDVEDDPASGTTDPIARIHKRLGLSS